MNICGKGTLIPRTGGKRGREGMRLRNPRRSIGRGIRATFPAHGFVVRPICAPRRPAPSKGNGLVASSHPGREGSSNASGWNRAWLAHSSRASDPRRLQLRHAPPSPNWRCKKAGRVESSPMANGELARNGGSVERTRGNRAGFGPLTRRESFRSATSAAFARTVSPNRSSRRGDAGRLFNRGPRRDRKRGRQGASAP